MSTVAVFGLIYVAFECGKETKCMDFSTSSRLQNDGIDYLDVNGQSQQKTINPHH
jgi:hypothetical protein